MVSLTVLAIGNGVLPLMLMLSPVFRSSAAIPTSADLFASSELSCCSTLDKSGDEAASAGCAPKANNDSRIAINRIALTREQRSHSKSSPNAHIRSKL